MNYICRWIGEFITSLGHVKVTVRTDGEPAILNIARRLADALRNDAMVGIKGIRAFLETAPRYSSQSMGGVGSFQRTLKTDVLTMRYDVEARYTFALGPGHNLWPWMVRWASFVRSRYGVKSNGRTAYQDAFDTDYTGDILPFGETAMFRMPGSKTGAVQGRKRVLKGDSLWRPGIFLGRTLQSTEYLFGAADGVHTARSLRRLPLPQRANKELMATFAGLPWDTKTSLKGPRRLPLSSGGRGALQQERHNRTRAGEAATWQSPARPATQDQQPLLVAESTSASSGVKRAPATETEDLEQEAGTMEIERPTGEKRSADNAEDSTKRLRIGGRLVAATLYRPDDPEEREFYDNAGDYLLDQEEEDELEDPEGTYAEEVKAGKLKELGKMDKYDTYEPRPLAEAQGKKILDSTWVVTRRPTGEVKCRYCLRDLKRGKKRDDVFAVASSQATARLIDTIGVKKGCFLHRRRRECLLAGPHKGGGLHVPARRVAGGKAGSRPALQRHRLEAEEGVVWPADRRPELR